MNRSDFLSLSDIDLRLANIDDLSRNAGFSRWGDVDRFVNAWGPSVVALTASKRPRGLLFILEPVKKSTQTSSLLHNEISQLINILIRGQAEKKIITVDIEFALLKEIPIDFDLQRQLSGGEWTPEQASKLSYSLKNKCICFASGRSFMVFINGVIVVSYADVVNRVFQSASETYNRQGWADGELLVRCGEIALSERSRRGIWHFPDYHVLTYKPEEMIKLGLESFLKEHLTGFNKITQEYHLESEGRVDLYIVLSDQTKYIVEIKWIGRSILKKYIDKNEKSLCDELKAKWKCNYVHVLEEDNAKRGVSQLAHYLSKPDVHKGYLAIYDCRPPGQASGGDSAASYPKPEGLWPTQYSIKHVPVDPRTASQRG